METFFRDHKCGRICQELLLHKEYVLAFGDDSDLDGRGGGTSTERMDGTNSNNDDQDLYGWRVLESEPRLRV